MPKTLTLDEVLLFAYGDLSDSIQEQSIKQLIRNDNQLYEEFLQITDVKQMIENSFEAPSDEVIERIIAYSKCVAKVKVAEPELRLMIPN